MLSDLYYLYLISNDLVILIKANCVSKCNCIIMTFKKAVYKWVGEIS